MKPLLFGLMLVTLTVSGCAHKITPPASIGGHTKDGGPPYAIKTPEAGVALSPYKPYSMLDVSNIKSGTVVLDPATGLPFRVP